LEQRATEDQELRSELSENKQMRDTLQEKKQECLQLKEEVVVLKKCVSEKEDMESKMRVLN
jgi:hypothetical protein